MAADKVLYKIDEAAEAVGYSRRTMYAWIRAGKIRAVKPSGPNGDWRIPADALDELVEQSSSNQDPAA